jgi:hypothetical protein
MYMNTTVGPECIKNDRYTQHDLDKLGLGHIPRKCEKKETRTMMFMGKVHTSLKCIKVACHFLFMKEL